jgi:ketosteroid isomerase-like protein
MLSEDVVFMLPGGDVVSGKAAVRPMADRHYKAFRTHWDRPLQEFVVCGEWAFGRYFYKTTDTSIEDGSVFEGTGWGLVIYHRDADGEWRVARDAWGSGELPQGD